jgi:hypothetical protein
MRNISVARGAARAMAIVAMMVPAGDAVAQSVLVTNIGQPIRATTIVDQSLWASQSFMTDGSSYLLAYVRTMLGLSVGSPTIVSQLRADNAGAPGALLTTFSFPTVPSGPTTLLTLTPGSTVALAPSTLYWIVFGVAGSGEFGWSYAQGNAQNGPGSLGSYAYSTDQGTTWGAFNNQDPYLIEVAVSTPNAVPEPATLSLIALGMLGAIGPIVRRSRRPAASS